MRPALLYFKRLLLALFLIPLLLACTTTPQKPTAQVLFSRWEAISLPNTENGSILSYAVSPDNPDLLYVCSNDLSKNGRILLWSSSDAGKHWSQLPFPATIGSDCTMSIDPAHSQFMAIDVVAYSGKQRACDQDNVYQSNDGGKSWQHISHKSIAPANGAYGFCILQAAAPYIYLWTTSIPSKSPQLSMLERTSDNGVHWSRIDEAFGPYALFSPPRVLGLDSKTLAISVLPKPPSGARAPSALWISQDAGQSWQQMGQVPGGTMLFTPSQLNGSQPSPSAPFYNVLGEQLPESLYKLQAFQSADGQHWSALPPLPIAGTSTAQPGLRQILAAMNDGRLLAFGPDPQSSSLNSQGSAASVSSPSTSSWLWIWNPASAQWQVFSVPLANSSQENCSTCWSALVSTSTDHQTYLYVSHQSESDSQSMSHTISRMYIPVASH